MNKSSTAPSRKDSHKSKENLTINMFRASSKKNRYLDRALDYLKRVLLKRGHHGVGSVVLRDNEIISEMNLTRAQFLQVIGKLAAAGIIMEKLENGCSYTGHACRYMLDRELLITEYGFDLLERPEKAINSAIEQQNGRQEEAVGGNTVITPDAAAKLLLKKKSKEIERVRFGINQRIRILTDEEISAAVAAKYPQVGECGQLIADINDSTDDRFRKIYMRPLIHRSASGICTSVSIRATTEFCDTSKHKPDSLRYRLLSKKFPEGWHEIDVSGSIPRVAHLMSTGEYPADSEDPYRVMFEPLLGFWDNRVRQICKALFMKLYFGGSAKRIIWLDTYKVLDEIRKQADDEMFTKTLGMTKKEILSIRRLLLTNKYRVYDCEAVEAGKRAVRAYCGENRTVSTDVFLHESAIYAAAAKRLCDAGIEFYQCYDAFYTSSNVSRQYVLNVIRECAEAYFSKWGNQPEAKDTSESDEIAVVSGAFAVFVWNYIIGKADVYNTGVNLLLTESEACKNSSSPDAGTAS